MATKQRPPQHRSDAPIVFIHANDDAWDEERIKREAAEMKARDEDPKQHPVARYLGGWTRYDIDAPATFNGAAVTVREYLDDSKKPTIWKLRRLTVEEWYEVEPMWQRSQSQGETPFRCYLRCLRYGLERVENGPTLSMPGGRIDDADLERIFNLGRNCKPPIDFPVAIGQAVYQASMALTEPEGKR